jgi:hypothetical protein
VIQQNHKNTQSFLSVIKHGRILEKFASAFCGFLKKTPARSTLLYKPALIAVAGLLVPGSMLLAGVFSPQAQAQTPNTTLNYQARILQSNGALVPDGNYHIEFKIYDTLSTGGTAQGTCTGNCLWMETRTTGNLVRVVNGYVSVNLGSVTAFGSTIPWSQDLYVTMRVGGSAGAASWDTEMTNGGNRMKISSTPLAFIANNVRTANRTSTNSDNITIQTGNTTTSGNSGNVAIDVGTAAGTTGTITLGATNASALTLGRTGVTTVNTGNLTIQGGTSNLGTTSVAGNLVVSDGSSSTVTIRSATQVAAVNYNLNIPAITSDDNFCLATLGNCFGSGSGSTLQAAYNADTDTGDTIITLSSADDSLIFRNPASSGSDSGYVLRVEQLSTAAAAQGVQITSATSGANANILEVFDDGTFADTSTFAINSSGNVGIGTNTPGEIKLRVVTTLATLGSQGLALEGNITYTAGAAENVITNRYSSTVNPTGAVGAGSTYYGAQFTLTAQNNDTRLATNGELINLNAFAGYSGNNTVLRAIGGRYYLNNSGTGTITNGFGLQVTSSNNSGTISNLAGLAISNQSTATNNTNLLVGTLNIPTGDWSIYNSSTNNNYFAGNLRVGTTGTPGAVLDVIASGTTVGAIINNGTSTGDILRVQDNGSTVLTVADGGGVNLQNFTNSTTALTVRNAVGTVIFGVDTANNQIGTASTTGASTNSQAIVLRSGSTTGTTSNTGDILVRSGSATNGNSGNIELEAGSASGTFGSINVGATYRSGAINIGIVGSAAIQSTVNIATTSGAATQSITIGSTSTTNNSVLLRSGSTGGVTTLSDAAIFQGVSASSATQLEVRDGSSTSVTLFVVDSANDRVQIGDTTADGTGVLLVLDTKNTAGDPTGAAGATYYNSNTGTFRCFTTIWSDCTGGGSKWTDNGNWTHLSHTGDRLIIGQTGDVTTTKLAVISTNSANNVSTFNTQASLTTTTASTRTFNTWLNTDIAPGSAVGANTNYSVLHLWTSTNSAGRLDATTDIRKIDLYTEYNSSSADTFGSASNIFTSDVVNSNVTISNFRSIQLNDPGGSGTITANTALNITNQTKGTNNTNLLIGTTTQASGNYSIYNSSTYTNLFQGSIVANNASVGTVGAGNTEATARTNVTTVTIDVGVGAFANNDVIFIDNAGQDYYTRITAGGGTTSMTVSPAVSYDANAAVTEYTYMNVGRDSYSATNLQQRFFEGYFLGGVVTGAGSTTLSDGNLTSTGSLSLRASTNAGVLFSTAGNAIFDVGTDYNLQIWNDGSDVGIEAYNDANSVKRNIVFSRYGGNIGVGVTPSTKLDVSGQLQVRNANYQVLFYDTDTSAVPWGLTTVGNTGFGIYEDPTGTPVARLTVAAGGATTISSTLAVSGTGTSSIAGGLNIDGTLRVNNSGSQGFVTLNEGTAAQSGYIAWFNTAGTRLMYQGWDNANVSLALENNADLVLTGGAIEGGYDCSVDLSFCTSQWFRSSGTTGWYNATYGGGIYMTDSSYVRTYASKHF